MVIGDMRPVISTDVSHLRPLARDWSDSQHARARLLFASDSARPHQPEPAVPASFVARSPECARARDRLDEFVDGTLSDESPFDVAVRTAIEQHLAHCHTCAQLAQQMQSLRSMLREVAQRESRREPVPDALRERVQAMLRNRTR